MFDSRYPNLHRIPGAPGVPHAERVKLAKFARRVASRTGTHECWDATSGTLYFYNGRPEFGVHRVPVVRSDRNFKIPGGKEEDAAVRYIQMCRRSAAAKDRELNFAEKDYQNEVAVAVKTKAEPIRKDAEKFVGGIRRNKVTFGAGKASKMAGSVQ